jgi:hypothetical protein
MTKWEVGKMYYTSGGHVAKVTEVTTNGYKGEIYSRNQSEPKKAHWFKTGWEFDLDEMGQKYNLTQYQARYTP